MNTKAKTVTVAVTLLICFVTSCLQKEETLVTSTPHPMTSTPYPISTPIPTVIEPGLAYGTPCKPPCWRGLIPGQSTRQDVAQAIEQASADGWAESIVDGSSVGGGYSISPSSFTSHGTIDVTMENDVVATIGTSTLSFYYPIGSLVEQFGAPERLYLVSRGATVCSSCEDWEPGKPVPSIPVHLLYPNQGLWFLALIPESGLGCICPEMKVTSFCYYDPITLQDAFTDNYLADLCSSNLKNVAQNDLVEWHGFGGGY